MYSLANFNIFGTGLDTLEQIALSSPAYSRLDAMGYPLNRSDGGLGLTDFCRIGIFNYCYFSNICCALSLQNY